MVYHLSVVDIIHEMNQEDTSESQKSHTLEMNITQTHYQYIFIVISFSKKEFFKSLKGITLSFLI